MMVLIDANVLSLFSGVDFSPSPENYDTKSNPIPIHFHKTEKSLTLISK